MGIAQTGLPFQVTQTGTQTNNATGTNRPNQVADFHVANATAGQWFDQAAFIAQAANSWGNEGRNLLNVPVSGISTFHCTESSSPLKL